MIMITYKLLRLGGKVNGIGPSIETESFMSFLAKILPVKGTINSILRKQLN